MTTTLYGMLLAGIGGFVGSALRYLTCRTLGGWWSGGFPLGTITVNIVGCLLFGLIGGWLQRSGQLPQVGAILLLTGFCGGFTTFSAFADDMLSLLNRGDWVLFALYFGLSILCGVAALILGRWMTA